jgi:hypothetical protein
MLNWRSAVLAAAAATLLLAGCAAAPQAGNRTSASSAAADARTAPKNPVPQQWRLVRASPSLLQITLAVPTCRRVTRIAVQESSTRAVITVYAADGPVCGWQRATLHTAFLTEQISCERGLVDGATGQHPEFAADADTASVTFACPANVPG